MIDELTATALDLVRAGRVTLDPGDCILVDGQDPTDDRLRVELEDLFMDRVIDAGPWRPDRNVSLWVCSD